MRPSVFAARFARDARGRGPGADAWARVSAQAARADRELALVDPAAAARRRRYRSARDADDAAATRWLLARLPPVFAPRECAPRDLPAVWEHRRRSGEEALSPKPGGKVARLLARVEAAGERPTAIESGAGHDGDGFWPWYGAAGDAWAAVRVAELDAAMLDAATIDERELIGSFARGRAAASAARSARAAAAEAEPVPSSPRPAPAPAPAEGEWGYVGQSIELEEPSSNSSTANATAVFEVSAAPASAAPQPPLAPPASVAPLSVAPPTALPALAPRLEDAVVVRRARPMSRPRDLARLRRRAAWPGSSYALWLRYGRALRELSS